MGKHQNLTQATADGSYPWATSQDPNLTQATADGSPLWAAFWPIVLPFGSGGPAVTFCSAARNFYQCINREK